MNYYKLMEKYNKYESYKSIEKTWSPLCKKNLHI